MNNEIIICVGIPGSGKSTFAKKWVTEDPKNRIRLNGEDILNSMTNNTYVKDVYGFIKYELMSNVIAHMIDENKNIILDNTHIDIDYLNYIYHTLSNLILNKNKTNDYTIIIKNFTNINPELCIERDSKRAKPVGREEINKCYLSKLDSVKDYLSKLETFDFGKLNVKFDKVY